MNRKGWREVKLGDVADIKNGKRNSQDAVKNGKYLLFDRSQKIKRSDCYIFDDSAIIVAGEGKEFAPRYYEGKFDLHQRCYAIYNFKDAVISKYVYYYLMDKKERFARMAVGSTVLSLRLNHFQNFPLYIPPLPKQKSIAEILSSLDDNIDLLHRQNKTLENLAQALFRKWFTDNPDRDNWETVELGNLVTCTTGYSYRSADLHPSEMALVTLKNFARDGSFRMDGYKEFVGKPKDKHVVEQGDLVVAHTDITQDADVVGNPALVVKPEKYKTLVMTMDLMKVESNEGWLSKEFLYYLFKSRDFKGHCLGHTGGTTVLHLSRKAVPSYRFKMPNKKMVIDFTEITAPLIQKGFSNIDTIKSLENLRDLLLPKLMNGNVAAKY